MSGEGAPASPARLLVVDVGSSSVKAAFIDLNGRQSPDSAIRIRYGWRTSGGAMETEAAGLLAVVEEALDAALDHDGGGEIAGVALAAFWHSLVGATAEGEAVTPVYGWADGRARTVAMRLRERMDEPDYHRRTGCFLHPAYPATRLAWLREEHPGMWNAGQRWRSAGDYLMERLTGADVSSVSMASGWGLLDLRTGLWDGESLAALDLDPGSLPPLETGEMPRLRRRYRSRWPALADVPWLPVEGDGTCAAVGAGAGEGAWVLTLGTSAAVRAVTPLPGNDLPADLWCYRVDGGRALLGGALSNAGAALTWLRDTLRLPEPEALDRILMERRPGAHGLDVTPTFLDERPPRWDADGASILGLRPATTPADVFHATIEAITYRIADVADALGAVLPPPPYLAANGGALRSLPAWGQLLADVTGLPVRHGDPEATARGAAVLGWARLGESSPAPSPPSEVLRPRPGFVELHRRRRTEREG